jgi:polyhydroxyalkanoate synthesis regulator phasin
MAAKKRSSSRSRPTGLVDRAVRVGRKALREAESRVPSDVRRQLERSIKDGQKTLKMAIDQLQVQVRRTAKQADVEKALKRLEGLSKQVQDLARGAASRGAAPRRRTRKPAGSAKRAAPAKRRTAPARRPATRAAARRTAPAPSTPAPRRRTAPRRAPAPPPEPEPGEGGS